MKWAEHAPQARSDFAQPMDPPDSNPLFEYLGGPGEKDLLQRCWQHHQKRRETCSELRLYPNQDNKNAIESAEAKTIQLDTIMTPWIRLLQIGSEF